jgi:hypothetical protein
MNCFSSPLRTAVLGISLVLCGVSSAIAAPDMPRGLSLSLYTKATYEDNYTRSDPDKTGETYFSTGLSLGYHRSGAMFDVSLTGSAGYQRNLHDSNGSGLVYSVSPTIAIHDGAWQLTFSGSASRQSGIADASLADTESGLYTSVDFTAGAALAVSDRLRLAANVGYATVIPDSSPAIDYGQDTIRADFSPYYVLTDSVSVGAKIGHTWIMYKDSMRSDVEGNTFGVFLNYTITDKLDAHIGTGLEWTDSSSGSSQDRSWYLDAGLGYAINTKLGAALSISHGVEASYSAGSNYRTADSARISFDYQVNRSLQLTTSFGYTMTDDEDGLKASEFLYSLGAVYRFTDYLSGEAGYTLDSYDPDSPGVDFTNNTCYIGVRVSL